MFDKHFQLSSPAVRICFCKSTSSYINKCSDHYGTKQKYPGARITIGVSALDYINQSVYTPIKAVIMNSLYNSIAEWRLGINEEIQNVFENQCTLLKYTILKSISEHSKARLYFAIIGEILQYLFLWRFLTVLLAFNIVIDLVVVNVIPSSMKRKSHLIVQLIQHL